MTTTSTLQDTIDVANILAQELLYQQVCNNNKAFRLRDFIVLFWKN